MKVSPVVPQTLISITQQVSLQLIWNHCSFALYLSWTAWNKTTGKWSFLLDYSQAVFHSWHSYTSLFWDQRQLSGQKVNSDVSATEWNMLPHKGANSYHGWLHPLRYRPNLLLLSHTIFFYAKQDFIGLGSMAETDWSGTIVHLCQVMVTFFTDQDSKIRDFPRNIVL